MLEVVEFEEQGRKGGVEHRESKKAGKRLFEDFLKDFDAFEHAILVFHLILQRPYSPLPQKNCVCVKRRRYSLYCF